MLGLLLSMPIMYSVKGAGVAELLLTGFLYIIIQYMCHLVSLCMKSIEELSSELLKRERQLQAMRTELTSTQHALHTLTPLTSLLQHQVGSYSNHGYWGCVLFDLCSPNVLFMCIYRF